MGLALEIANTYGANAPRYHALGFIPIPARDDTKTAKVTWKEKQGGLTRSELHEIISEHGASQSMGTVIPIMSPFCVLDFDDGAYQRLHDEFGYELPANTPVVRTGGTSASTGARDRYHVYYKWGRHRSLAKSVKEGALFDGIKVGLRCDRLFVVLPPSVHKSGNRYEWLPGQAPWEVNMQEIPPLLVQAILQKNGWDFDKYKPSDFDYKTIRELSEMRDGDGRDDYIIKDLGWARNQEALGFDPETPDIAKLRDRAEYVNSLFGEPLDDSSISQKVDSSFRMWVHSADAESLGQVDINGRIYELNSLGIIDKFADDTAEWLKWHRTKKTWITYTGKFWQVREKDDNVAPTKAMRKTVSTLPELASGISDEETRRAVHKKLSALKAKWSEVGGMSKLVDFAGGHGLDGVGVADMNTTQGILNFQNGTLDLRTRTLRAHDPEDKHTAISPIEYDPDAECPLWEKFVSEALEGDEERIKYIQRAFGYALTESCKRAMFFVLHGDGNNGKSVMLQTIARILGHLGDGYAVAAKIGSFLMSRKAVEGIGNDILEMAGERFAYAEEPHRGAKWNDGLLKDLSAGGVQNGRLLWANNERFEFHPKLFFACNHLPEMNDTSRGIERRMCIIPFSKGLPSDKVDIDLPEKLMLEAPGIMNWMLSGLQMLNDMGGRSLDTRTCASIDAATKQYLQSNDRFQQFLNEATVPGDRVKKTAFRKAYAAWVLSNGDTDRPSAKNVTELMTAKGYKSKASNGVDYWDGVDLKPEWLAEADIVGGGRREVPSEY